MRKTYYPCNVCGKRFNTATKRTTHEMNIKNSKVKADFGRFKIITINIQPDYCGYIDSTAKTLVKLVPTSIYCASDVKLMYLVMWVQI